MTTNKRPLSWRSLALLACLLGLARAAEAEDRVTPGELVIDHPTLIKLGFEWIVQGDDNRNAAGAVTYRQQGENQWKQGLPLLRLQGERIYQENSWNLISPNMFAGSILDLKPDTAYEARFVLSDPDGVVDQNPAAARTVIVRTRPEPKSFAGGRVYHVYPPTYTGTKAEPAFEGIMCAYYYVCGGGDTTSTARPRVKAGDTILVHAGVYKYRPEFYGPDRSLNVTSPYEGTYYLTASGTPDKPIAIKAAGDGEVVIDGNGNFNLFNVQAADYTYFEGLTIRNTDIAILAGRQFIAGSKGLTVKHCRLENVGMGVFSNYSGSSDFYIADNYFIGRDDPTRLLGWSGTFWAQFKGVDGQEFPPKMASYVAVKIYGPGHVVAYNYVADFHDDIDVETYGNPDGSHHLDGPQYPTKEDQHSLAIDYDIFMNVRKLDAQDLGNVQKLYKAEDLDFRLKPGSAAVDRGVALPNITDGFAGRAPDLGVSKWDKSRPIMGPVSHRKGRVMGERTRRNGVGPESGIREKGRRRFLTQMAAGLLGTGATIKIGEGDSAGAPCA